MCFNFVISQSMPCPEHEQYWKVHLIVIIYLIKTLLHLCVRNDIIDLYVLMQSLQGRFTPSRWCASMWSLIAVGGPSFPYTLHILTLFLSFPCWMNFSLFSIKDFTFHQSFVGLQKHVLELLLLIQSHFPHLCIFVLCKQYHLFTKGSHYLSSHPV